jgi:mono/diheme cytochrome c family protein
MQTRWVVIFLITAILPGAGAAREQDTLAGMQIAQAWCSDCHLIDPRERKSGRNSAPLFYLSPE